MPKKWGDATPAEKTVQLIRLFLSGKSYSLSELSYELRTSKQSVKRLMDNLERSYGSALRYTKRGREAVYEIDCDKTPLRFSLDAEGLQQLALCQAFLQPILPQSLTKNAQNVLQAAAETLPPGEKRSTASAGLITKGRIDYSPFQKQLNTLINAIHEKKVCAVRYRTALHAREKNWHFAPQRLDLYHEVLFVIGWIVNAQKAAEPLYDAPTTLALQRVLAVEATPRYAKALPQLPASAELFGVVDDKDAFSADIHFTADAATYIAERIWSDKQKIVRHRNGSITLTLQAKSRMEIIAWILSFGETARVEKPRWLQKAVLDALSAAQKRYKAV